MPRAFNIHQAKTHLSRLVEQAVAGEEFVIGKAGKPLVRVVAIAEKPQIAPRRLGFLAGRIHVPDDFDTMFGDEIAAMFNGDE